jgi:hypothetical protein
MLCWGRGYYPRTISDDHDDLHEVYCECPAGMVLEQREAESTLNESVAEDAKQ